MKRAFLALLIVSAMFLVIGAQAQSPEPAPPPPQSTDQVDMQSADYDRGDNNGPQRAPAPPTQPAQGVARMSFIHGDVSMLRGDSGEWVATTLNTPISQGNWVATGDKSRAELQLDFANILRLSASSEAKVADLTHARIQLQLAQGYASFTQMKGSEADVEIDTPNVAVHPLKHGRYRIQVNSDMETIVIVRDGEVDITTPQGSTRLRQGEMITVRGTDNPEYHVSRAPGTDDWDRWNKDRDHVIEDADGWRRTNRYYTGAQDLDAYGHWVNVPGYGSVWAPYNTDASWAPYQAGRWVWEPYYGWTWVSYEPWGWAPYHYGRWFFYGASWYWWPGPIHRYYRPVWAPAFVVFLGFGHHSGFGFGSIGWLPCGPHDYYYPWWGRGRRNVSVTNITVINVNRGGAFAPLAGRHQPVMSNVNLAISNARVRGSISSVRSEDFGRGVRATGGGSLSAMDVRQAQAVTGNLPVVPGRESLGAAGKKPFEGNRGAGNDRFFSKQAPPASGPSFQQQQGQMQEVLRARGGTGGLMAPGQSTHGGPAGGMTPAPATRGGPTGGMTTAPPVMGNGPTGGMTPAPPARVGGPTGGMTPAPPARIGGPTGGMTPAPPMPPSPQSRGNGPTGGMTPVPVTPKPPVADQPRQDQGQRGGRDGWQTFGSPHGQPGPSPVTPAPVMRPMPPTTNVPAPPPAGRQDNNGPRSMPQTPQIQRNDRVTPPPPPPSGRGADSRPQVELNRPIVTPRPPEPMRNTPPPARIERSAPPPPAPRVERSSPPPSPSRSSAPSHSESHGSSGGGSHSSGGSSHGSSSSSGDKGSHDHSHH